MEEESVEEGESVGSERQLRKSGGLNRRAYGRGGPWAKMIGFHKTSVSIGVEYRPTLYQRLRDVPIAIQDDDREILRAKTGTSYRDLRGGERTFGDIRTAAAGNTLHVHVDLKEEPMQQGVRDAMQEKTEPILVLTKHVFTSRGPTAWRWGARAADSRSTMEVFVPGRKPRRLTFGNYTKAFANHQTTSLPLPVDRTLRSLARHDDGKRHDPNGKEPDPDAKTSSRKTGSSTAGDRGRTDADGGATLTAGSRRLRAWRLWSGVTAANSRSWSKRMRLWHRRHRLRPRVRPCAPRSSSPSTKTQVDNAVLEVDRPLLIVTMNRNTRMTPCWKRSPANRREVSLRNWRKVKRARLIARSGKHATAEVRHHFDFTRPLSVHHRQRTIALGRDEITVQPSSSPEQRTTTTDGDEPTAPPEHRTESPDHAGCDEKQPRVEIPTPTPTPTMSSGS